METNSWVQNSGITDRAQLVDIARLSEQAERYEDMAIAIRYVAEMDKELNDEERNLFTVAYKNVIGTRRSAWSKMNKVEERMEGTGWRHLHSTLYKEKVDNELREIAKSVIDVIDNFLLTKASTAESKVFYLKMNGDYYRYLAELAVNDKQDIHESMEAYKKASIIAEAELLPTNYIRLGLALNYAVFFYEICHQPDQACQLAKKSFDEAITDLEEIPEETYQASSLILQLLRDNLTIWTSEQDPFDEPTS